ncbi:MAG TPA: bifunctional DNA-binding transcriptional regulator/O6-methylguanine-DNA methyltransferase Ada [Steroidobacteraceae bacterium]|nr:bifunctional DNA-binding transcriptional regulator/O6-methylguanine-DNA methyltransferase Ada [Steroidobacteraceae bacterium]
MTTRKSTDDARWDAVVSKDKRADGQFYFSVRTTGVYCRPSCPARRARRENVAFHLSCEAAEAAGFRSCKRCRPREASQSERDAALIARACSLIEKSDEPLRLASLAAASGLSPFHFHRLFKAATGLTPKAYGDAHRADRVRKALPSSKTVTAAIYDAGFNSNGRFYASSAQVLGMTPGRYRAGGQWVKIRFAIGECSLGSILVAATDKGVCAILMGNDPEALVRELQDRFAKAELIGGDARFETLVAKVVGFVEQPRLGLDLPLDVRGTAFQQRVWKALRQIGVGKTASYGEIAARIGNPKSIRAVAQACAANMLAVAIPCHRVIRTDGQLSGYRWGVQRKRALLEREKRA